MISYTSATMAFTFHFSRSTVYFMVGRAYRSRGEGKQMYEAVQALFPTRATGYSAWEAVTSEELAKMPYLPTNTAYVSYHETLHSQPVKACDAHGRNLGEYRPTRWDGQRRWVERAGHVVPDN